MSVSAPSTASSTIGPTQQSGTASSVAGSLNEGDFLNLMMDQMKNQDPLNPTDGTQFLSQLAQFSELEQVIAIRTDIEAQGKAPAGSEPATTPAAAGTTK